MTLIVEEDLSIMAIRYGFVDILPNAVITSAIEVRLSNILHIEQEVKHNNVIIPKKTTDAAAPKFNFTYHDLAQKSFLLSPQQFINAQLLEFCSIPVNVTGFFYLDTLLSKYGLQCNGTVMLSPGWRGRLRFGLQNNSQFHYIQLTNEMFIGKIVFVKHDSTSGHQTHTLQLLGEDSDKNCAICNICDTEHTSVIK